MVSEIGKIACKIWETIAERFVDVKLDEFVLMPNHVHGIIIIDKQNNNAGRDAINAGRDAINRVSTMAGDSDKDLKTGGITGNQNPMLHTNLSRIIRWYKGRMTFESRKINEGFAWQERFYEHVVNLRVSRHFYFF